MSSGRFKCEFAAGVDGRIASGVWRLWAGKNSPDLYLACKAVAGTVKATIHLPRPPDKMCTWRRWGFTSEATGVVADFAIQRGGRHKQTWSGAQIGNDCTVEWRVIIPGGPMLAPNPYEAPSGITLLPAPAVDEALIVLIGFGSIPPRCSDATLHFLADGRLANGTEFWSSYCYTPLSDVNIPEARGNITFHGSRCEARRAAAAGTLRAIGVAPNSDGSLGFVDWRVLSKD